jgi:hypothetical protein
MAVLLAGASACAPKRVVLPGGPGTPFPDATAAYEEAVAECRGARTIRATLSLSGRAGSTRLRGDVDAGFEAPERVRLEGRHPLGRPVFILAAGGPLATLLLPRENRVLRAVAAREVVEALVGLPLGGAELRAIVSGCGFGAAEVTAGRAYPDGWLALDSGDSTTWLRQVDRRWRVVAATRAPLAVHYAAFAQGRAATLRLQSSGPPPSDVTVRLSDVNINVPLEPAVFQVDVPLGADPLTLEELRQAGPLGVPAAGS